MGEGRLGLSILFTVVTTLTPSTATAGRPSRHVPARAGVPGTASAAVVVGGRRPAPTATISGGSPVSRPSGTATTASSSPPATPTSSENGVAGATVTVAITGVAVARNAVYGTVSGGAAGLKGATGTAGVAVGAGTTTGAAFGHRNGASTTGPTGTWRGAGRPPSGRATRPAFADAGAPGRGAPPGHVTGKTDGTRT